MIANDVRVAVDRTAVRLEEVFLTEGENLLTVRKCLFTVFW